MDFLKAICLAVVEGITEFLPISSTGHMILAQFVRVGGDSRVLFPAYLREGSGPCPLKSQI